MNRALFMLSTGLLSGLVVGQQIDRVFWLPDSWPSYNYSGYVV